MGRMGRATASRTLLALSFAAMIFGATVLHLWGLAIALWVLLVLAMLATR